MASKVRARAVMHRAAGLRALASAADAKLLDDLLVALLVLALHIVEQLAALAHHLEQAAARMIVFLVQS